MEIRIDGFRPVSNEVVFVDMGSEDEGEYEPLLGYVILEQAQAAVDMLGHRLVPVKYIDMKSVRRGDFAPSVTCRHDTTRAGPSHDAGPASSLLIVSGVQPRIS